MSFNKKMVRLPAKTEPTTQSRNLLSPIIFYWLKRRPEKVVKTTAQQILAAGAAVSYAMMEALFATVANGMRFQNAIGQNNWE